MIEEKTEQAFINYLQNVQGLEDVEFTVHDSGNPKGTKVIVSATRGDQIAENTGVYFLDVTIELQVPVVNRSSLALDEFKNRVSIVTDAVLKYKLHETLNSYMDNWHCYFVALQGSERDPEPSRHVYIMSLTVEAMNGTLSQARKSRENL